MWRRLHVRTICGSNKAICLRARRSRLVSARADRLSEGRRVCLRDDLDELLTCFRYPTLEARKAVRTTNAIKRRYREVRRRTRPMGVFKDRTSMDR